MVWVAVTGSSMDWQSIISSATTRDLAIGVLGGLIVLALERFFVLVVLPIYRGRTQRLPNFDGTIWNGFSDDEAHSGEAHSSLKIKQTGNKIFAEVTRTVKNGQRKFKYTGTMYGSQIVLEFFDEQGPGLIVGTMVLHIGSDLRTLRGASTYFHHDKGKVVSSFRTYRRVDGPTEPASTSLAPINCSGSDVI